jgi:hypothetical protein
MDPISRLRFARDEIDRVFGEGYAAQHPDVVASVMMSAAIDFHALSIARALEGVMSVLIEDEPLVPIKRTGILR